MGCCSSCDSGGPCEGCGGACGGKCDGRCGKNPADVHSHSHDEAHYHGDGHNHAAVYDAVMGGPLADKIKQNTSLWRDGELLFVRYQSPNRKGSIVVSVPFAPVMMFCQNLAMLHGKPDTRPNTVMGFAPILAMLTSQLASKKIVDDADKSVDGRNDSSSSRSPGASRPVDANDQGPAILQSLLKMLPGLTSMVGVYYDQENDGSDEMGLSCGPASSIRNTPACRHYHGMRGEDDMRGEAIDMGGATPYGGSNSDRADRAYHYYLANKYSMNLDELGDMLFFVAEAGQNERTKEVYRTAIGRIMSELSEPQRSKALASLRSISDANGNFMRGEAIDMGGCGCGTGVGGGCGCGIPCDGIQPNAPYMSEYHVTQRNAPFVPRLVQRTNYDWNRVERINTQAQNNFGRASHMDSSAAPVHTDIGGYHDEYGEDGSFHEEQVPCAKGGTCGKSCCGSH